MQFYHHEIFVILIFIDLFIYLSFFFAGVSSTGVTVLKFPHTATSGIGRPPGIEDDDHSHIKLSYQPVGSNNVKSGSSSSSSSGSSSSKGSSSGSASCSASGSSSDRESTSVGRSSGSGISSGSTSDEKLSEVVKLIIESNKMNVTDDSLTIVTESINTVSIQNDNTESSTQMIIAGSSIINSSSSGSSSDSNSDNKDDNTSDINNSNTDDDKHTNSISSNTSTDTTSSSSSNITIINSSSSSNSNNNDSTQKSTQLALIPQASPSAYFEPFTIPKGHVWLAGDNTENSTDSR